MVTVHPKILEKDGKKEFAVIPYDEFLAMQEALDDYAALKALREAKADEAGAAAISFDEAKKELEIE